MSDMISGVAGQIFQQILENQGFKQQQQPQTSANKSFESYLQQDNKTNTENTQTQTTEKIQEPKTSGAEMQRKLDQMEAELAQKFKEQNQNQSNFNKMMPELLESKSRLGMLKEAYSKIGDTAKMTSDLSGRFVQVESEYKAVEAVMMSDKNLSTGELLALQARLYQVGQHIEVMSKVVDQMAGGIKTVLNTNV
jgi:predicted RNase H-like nuclease (RuvC/YqgF family)